MTECMILEAGLLLVGKVMHDSGQAGVGIIDQGHHIDLEGYTEWIGIYH